MNTMNATVKERIEEDYGKFVDAILPSNIATLVLDFKPYHGIQQELMRELVFHVQNKEFRNFFESIRNYSGISYFTISIYNDDLEEEETKFIYNNPCNSPYDDRYRREVNRPIGELIGREFTDYNFETEFIPTGASIDIGYEGFIGNFANDFRIDENIWKFTETCWCGNRTTYRLTRGSYQLDLNIIFTNFYARSSFFLGCLCD